MVAKIRRVEPGITLNPKSGCPILTETTGDLEVTGGGVVVGGGGEPVAEGGPVTGGGVVVAAGLTVKVTGLDVPAP